ncbi:CDK inhibitor Srw1 [Histomonas meleagridis]|uniref:CDK inhibitor Srw1 n=1 Tax=Histomonas meleagridis TaxID=135588 RepID=UPI00355A1270|nr:CDK inhibitor Srw1 [Histomonas meleagridis]KAH0803929.1 CDK inhibitor Srw1 [Histomonas meleagridis]
MQKSPYANTRAPKQRTQSAHILRFCISDLKMQNQSPYDKDRFFNSPIKSPKNRTPTKSPIKSCQTSEWPSTSKSPQTPTKIIQSPCKKKAPIAVDKVLDAPDLFNSYPSKLIDFKQRTLAVALNTCVYIWEDGNTTELMEANSPITSLCWTDKGLVISASGEVELWDPIKCSMIQSFKSHDIKCGAMSFKGHRFASGGADNNINITDIRTNITNVFNEHKSEITHLSWSTDGSHLASTDLYTVNIWGDQKKKTYNFDQSISSFTWVSSNIFSVTNAMDDGNIKVISMHPEDVLYNINIGTPISGIKYTNKWGYIVTHARNDFSWELLTQDCKKYGKYNGHTGDIINITVNEEENVVATLGMDETLRIWELKENQIKTPKKNPHSSIPIGFNLSLR